MWSWVPLHKAIVTESSRLRSSQTPPKVAKHVPILTHTHQPVMIDVPCKRAYIMRATFFILGARRCLASAGRGLPPKARKKELPACPETGSSETRNWRCACGRGLAPTFCKRVSAATARILRRGQLAFFWPIELCLCHPTCSWLRGGSLGAH